MNKEPAMAATRKGLRLQYSQMCCAACLVCSAIASSGGGGGGGGGGTNTTGARIADARWLA
jgi:hypothetical protein